MLVLEGTERHVKSLAFSPDGKPLLAAHHRNSLEVYNPDTGQRVAQLSLKTKYYEAFAFTANGEHLIAVSNEKTAKIYDTDTRTERQTQDWGSGR
jgi:WD40 repeat protein